MNINVTEDSLESYWVSMFGNMTDTSSIEAKFTFINNFKQLLYDNHNHQLNLETNVWNLKIKEHIFKHTAAHSIASTIFQHFEYAELPVILLSLIINVIMDAEKIKIDKKDEDIYLDLAVKNECKSFKTIEEWYQFLPNNIREQTHILDFEDFLERLVFAGLAATNNGEYLVHKLGEKKVKIHIS